MRDDSCALFGIRIGIIAILIIAFLIEIYNLRYLIRNI